MAKGKTKKSTETQIETVENIAENVNVQEIAESIQSNDAELLIDVEQKNDEIKSEIKEEIKAVDELASEIKELEKTDVNDIENKTVEQIEKAIEKVNAVKEKVQTAIKTKRKVNNNQHFTSWWNGTGEYYG